MRKHELPPDLTLSDIGRALEMIDEGRANNIVNHVQNAAAMRHGEQSEQPEDQALTLPTHISDRDMKIAAEYGDLAPPDAYDNPSNSVKEVPKDRDVKWD